MNARHISEAVNAMQKARTFIAQCDVPYDGELIGVITDLSNSETVFRMELTAISVNVITE